MREKNLKQALKNLGKCDRISLTEQFLTERIKNMGLIAMFRKRPKTSTTEKIAPIQRPTVAKPTPKSTVAEEAKAVAAEPIVTKVA